MKTESKELVKAMWIEALESGRYKQAMLDTPNLATADEFTRGIFLAWFTIGYCDGLEDATLRDKPGRKYDA